MNSKPVFVIHDKNPQHTALVFKQEISIALAVQAKEKYSQIDIENNNDTGNGNSTVRTI